MRKISLVTSAVLLSSTMALADSNSIKEAFANGTTSGDITVYYEDTNAKGTTDDSGLTAGSIGLSYETDSVNGFSLSLGARAQHEFSEEEELDYEGSFANDAIIHTIALKYANEDFFISAGRQEIDLEWLGDYNESVVVGITAVPDTTIVLGYTDRQAEIGFDTTADFAEVTEKGAYVIDVKKIQVLKT